MNLIEVTDNQTGFKTIINVDKILMVTGSNRAIIIFENSNLSANESYEQVKSLLNK